MLVAGVLNSLRPGMKKCSAQASGGSIIRLIDPSLCYVSSDIDIYVPGQKNYLSMKGYLDSMGYTELESPKRTSKYIDKTAMYSSEYFDGRLVKDDIPYVDDYENEPFVEENTANSHIFAVSDFKKRDRVFNIQIIGYHGKIGQYLEDYDLSICKATWSPDEGIGLSLTDDWVIGGVY